MRGDYQPPFGFERAPPEGFGTGGRFAFGGFGGLGGGFGGFGGGFFGFPGGYFNHNYQSPFSRRETTEAYRQRLEKETEKRMAENLARCREGRDKHDAAEAARKKAKDAAKQAEKDTRGRERTDRQMEERVRQEARWATLDPSATEDERLAACLHSDFCTKMPQGHKFRCGACSARRGTTAFVCPYCDVLLCQLCVSNFGARRARAEKKQPDPEPETEPEPETVETRPENTTNGKKMSGPGDKKRNKNHSVGSKACFNCGEIGHMAKKCPAPSSGFDVKEGRPASSSKPNGRRGSRRQKQQQQ